MKKTIYHITLALCLLGGLGALTLKRLDLAYPPDLALCTDYAPTVYDRHGQMLHTWLTADGKRRLPPGALPVSYTALLLNYEDRRYYQHHGIDPVAVIRALGENLRGGGIRSGASTLTMQAARLIYRTPHTLSGKIHQTLRALQLEYHYDKAAILNCYASLAPMGGNIEGITAGAWHHFGKTPAELSIGETAWLIALPQNPNRLADPDRARAARNRVLDRALQKNLIDAETHHNASHEPLAPAPHPFPQHAPHYAALARSRGETTTTLDRDQQTRLETILAAALPTRPPRSNLAALILDNQSGETRAYLGSADYHDKTRLGANNLLTAIRSPGSTLKPYITLYAFDHYRLHPHTPIDDTPLAGGYNPDNYDQKYLGRITLAEALQRSRNTPAVRLLERIGPDTFATWLEQHGLHLTILHNSPPNLTIALGGVGIRATELADLYRQLANCTYRPEQPAPLASQRACLQTSQILQKIGDSGGVLKHGAEPVALKTGTAYGWRDLWAIAYSRDYTVLLWGGRADGGYNDQRASAEALIPLMRQIVAILPNPPRHYTAPQPAWETRENTVAAPPAPGLRITAPTSGATIQNRGQAITLQTDGGVPPYTWLANRQLLRQTHSPQTLWQPPGDGDYTLDVSDQNGNHARVQLRLETPPEHPAATVRLQPAH